VKSRLKNLVRKAVLRLFRDLVDQQTASSLLLAKLHIRDLRTRGILESIQDAEFKVFSQGGEDGIIQYLLQQVPIAREVFVEFGVENYLESNTRFLLLNDNWSGLVIDAHPSHIKFIRRDPLSYRRDLQSICSFITAENINDLLVGAGLQGDIGLLSIDLDGNDYWVWQAIEEVSPRLVICEYNSIFGSDKAVTIPYDPFFERTKAHFSNLYYGTSLAALCALARVRGYRFVGSNSAGNNAFFVREDVVGNLQQLSPEAGYVESRFRESRDRKGQFSFLRGADRLREIADCPLLDLDLDAQLTIKEIYKD
jgi:hypothetical protein